MHEPATINDSGESHSAAGKHDTEEHKEQTEVGRHQAFDLTPYLSHLQPTVIAVDDTVNNQDDDDDDDHTACTHTYSFTHGNLAKLQLSDLQCLQPYNYLQQLNLSYNNLSSSHQLTPLYSLPYLHTIDLSHNQLTTFIPYTPSQTGITCVLGDTLHTLDLSHNALSNLDAVYQYPAISQLWASNNQLQGVKGVHQLKSLRELDVSHNALTTLQHIRALPSLSSLRALHNQLVAIDFSDTLPLLRTLDLSHNHLQTLRISPHNTWAHCLPSMHTLCITHNQLSELSDLTELQCLQLLHTLDVGGNALNDNRLNVIYLLQHLHTLNSERVTAAELVESKRVNDHYIQQQQLHAAHYLPDGNATQWKNPEVDEQQYWRQTLAQNHSLVQQYHPLMAFVRTAPSGEPLHLSLTHHSLDVTGLWVLCRALNQRNDVPLHLDLSYTRCDLHSDDAGISIVLKMLCQTLLRTQLQSLDLSSMDVQPSVLISHLAPLFQQSTTLQSLSINHTDLASMVGGDEQVLTPTTPLYQLMSSLNGVLTELNLCNTQLRHSDAVRVIANQLQSIQSLNLSQNALTASLSPLCDILRSNATLKTLRLASCQLQVDDLQAVSNTLSTYNDILLELDLSNNTDSFDSDESTALLHAVLDRDTRYRHQRCTVQQVDVTNTNVSCSNLASLRSLESVAVHGVIITAADHDHCCGTNSDEAEKHAS